MHISNEYFICTNVANNKLCYSNIVNNVIIMKG